MQSNLTLTPSTSIGKITLAVIILSAFSLPLSSTAANILFPIAAIFSMMHRHWRTHIKQILIHPVAIACLLVTGLYLFSISYTIAPNHDILHQFTKISCLMCSAILIGSPPNVKTWRYPITAFLIAMLITLFLSYLKYYCHPAILMNPHFGQASVFKNRITQNFLLTFSVFIFIYRWLHHYPFRPAYGALILLALYNIFFMSAGRSGYYVFFILLSYLFMQHWGWKRGTLISIVAVVVLPGLLYMSSPIFKLRINSAVQDLIAHRHAKNNTSLGIRIESMKNAYQLIKKKPWFGHGIGSFYTAYSTLPKQTTRATIHAPLSYNSYLNIGVSLGIIGVLSLLYLFGIQWQYTAYLSAEKKFIIQAFLLCIAFGSLINPWLSDTTELHAYAFLMGLGFMGTWKQTRPVPITVAFETSH